MPYIKEVTGIEFFNAPNINDLICEYASAGSNPLVQKVVPSVFVPAVRDAFLLKEKKENLKFNLLIDDNGLAKGLLIYSLYVNGNSPELIADVNSIYVTPIFRRKGYGTKILNALFKQAKSYGASGIYFSAPYGSRLEKVFARLFKPVYVDFFKEL